MNILLVAINAKYIHSNPAVYCLAGYVADYAAAHADEEPSQVTINIAEYTINMPSENILADIYKRAPSVIMFSCYIWNIRLIEELVNELGKLFPNVPIWLGGPEASNDADGCLKRMHPVAGVMFGEGEETFLELTSFYASADTVTEKDGKSNEERKQLESVRGLYLRRSDGSYIMTGKRDIMNITNYENRLISRYVQDCSDRIIYYESSRGCPFSCSYCLSCIEKPVRYKSIQVVERELRIFLERRVKQVKFIDRTFNCNKNRATHIWRFVLENDNGITNFHFEIGADLLEDEQLRLFKQMRPGLIQLEIGVQSTNKDTLRAINRMSDTALIARNTAIIQGFGNIHQHLDLIAGLPYEDIISFEKSFCEVYAMKPNQLQLGFLKVLKGTPMYDKREEYALIYRTYPPYEILETLWLKYDDICTLKQIEMMVEYYYNSNQYEFSLKYLENFHLNPFKMYLKLAAYYDKSHYIGTQYSRLQRYEILFRYAASTEIITREELSIFGEILLFDMYLRENVKHRPFFAREQREYSTTYKCVQRDKEFIKCYGENIHLEHISVETAEFLCEQGAVKQQEKTSMGSFIIFNYSNRNKINQNAAAELIELVH